jgi:threonine dehydrogenase-like Zn-dependent dehydrogenase
VRRVSVPTDGVVVVGAGASALVLALVADEYRHVEAVDLSDGALDQLRNHVAGVLAVGSVDPVSYRRCNVTQLTVGEPVAVWHDRAVFHFLIDSAQRQEYAQRAAAAVRPGGHLVLAVFSEHGPEQCSGLPVRRSSVDDLVEVFGSAFDLVEHFEQVHRTPWDAEQSFLHVLFRRVC